MTTTDNQDGKKIKLSEAKEMIGNYLKTCADDDIRSFSISASFLKSIIEQEKCEFVKFYLCAPDAGSKPSPLSPGHSLVVVGADSQKSVLLKGTTDDDDNEIYEELGKCPPNCSDDGVFGF